METAGDTHDRGSGENGEVFLCHLCFLCGESSAASILRYLGTAVPSLSGVDVERYAAEGIVFTGGVGVVNEATILEHEHAAVPVC